MDDHHAVVPCARAACALYCQTLAQVDVEIGDGSSSSGKRREGGARSATRFACLTIIADAAVADQPPAAVRRRADPVGLARH
jgi:hypothetical protein